MTRVNELHQKWMKNKYYRNARAELTLEFALARAVINARTRPSTQTLERVALATGTRLPINLVPTDSGERRPSAQRTTTGAE